MNINTIRSLRIAVDYGKSLQQMIADGKYDWVDSKITPKRFPLVPAYTTEMFETKLFRLGHGISSRHAVGAIKASDSANPWMPARIEHLLTYGAKYPDEQRHYPIIGLGSVARVHGSRRVPCLDRRDAARRLGRGWWGSGWSGRCRFLAVRKLP